MPSLAPNAALRDHAARETLGPPANTVVSVRVPAALSQHYARRASALGIPAAVLFRCALLTWLESPEGGGLPPGTGLTPP